MQTAVDPSIIRTLVELKQEMTDAQRPADAEAIREALAVLVRPSHGWLSTGQAAEKLGVTVPTVKDWIRRGTLQGQPVGSRWRVTAASVDKVLSVRGILVEMEAEGYPTDEEIQDLTRKVRRRMVAERAPTTG